MFRFGFQGSLGSLLSMTRATGWVLYALIIMLLFNSWVRHKEGYYKMFHHERQLNIACAGQNLFQPFLWGWRYTFFRITHGNILPEGTAEHILAPPFLTLAKIYIGRGQRSEEEEEVRYSFCATESAPSSSYGCCCILR